MKNKLMSLLEVRKLIALSVTLMFVLLAFMGIIEPKLIEYVIISVISFYFAKSTALDVPKTTGTIDTTTETTDAFIDKGGSL